ANGLEGSIINWPKYSENQYQIFRQTVHTEILFQPFNETTKLPWTSVINYQTGKKNFVPASLIYLPPKNSEDDNLIFPSLSTGLSAQRNAVSAIMQGTMEILERDAFTLGWLAGSPLPMVDQTWTYKFAKKLGLPKTWKLKLVDLQNNTGVAIYCASIFAPSIEKPIFAVGAAASLEPILAAKKAILEAMQTIPYIRHLMRVEPNWHPGPDFSRLISFKDHCRVYSILDQPLEGLQYLHPDRELTGSSDTIQCTFPSDKSVKFETFDSLITHLEKENIELFVKRLTTRDVYQHSWEVVRVLSPQLMPLHGHYLLPHLTCERLWKLKEIFPFDIKQPKSEKEVYAWPHPFA
ncbi:MAG: YcaO-like family protein, partial [Candidatus Heimdallarchaeota archaeon]|nr:YcaO-like family protein [Candidatus Heimdallarchaeota archaeon]